MPTRNVLFVCPDNALWGPLAETCLNRFGRGAYRAFSAGRAPAPRLASGVSRVLRREGVDPALCAPKSWDIFAMPHAPGMDVVIALDGAVDGPQQPAWTGGPDRVLWNMQPAGTAGVPEDAEAAWAALCERVAHLLDARPRLHPIRSRQTPVAPAATHSTTPVAIAS